jgi:ribosomal protein S17E
MMIDQIRRTADELYESKRGEVGWILDDNKGMVAIADAINSKINREYIVFGKDLI